jgi:hypothetical protein
MLALIFIAVATPLLAIVLLRVLALRAIPLSTGAAGLGLAGSGAGSWATAFLVAVFLYALSALVLDELRKVRLTSGLLSLIETASGVGVAALVVFAVFYSSGVRGLALMLALLSGTGIALLTSLQQRAHW